MRERMSLNYLDRSISCGKRAPACARLGTGGCLPSPGRGSSGMFPGEETHGNARKNTFSPAYLLYAFPGVHHLGIHLYRLQADTRSRGAIFCRWRAFPGRRCPAYGSPHAARPLDASHPQGFKYTDFSGTPHGGCGLWFCRSRTDPDPVISGSCPEQRNTHPHDSCRVFFRWRAQACGAADFSGFSPEPAALLLSAGSSAEGIRGSIPCSGVSRLFLPTSDGLPVRFS